MKRIVVASSNPVKLRAVAAGFQSMYPGEEFELTGLPTESGVSAQPASDAETRLGAEQRATRAASLQPEADFWVGVEGGVELHAAISTQVPEMAAFAWVVILSRARKGYARTATFFLPPEVVSLVASGLELGDADDIVFGRTNSKQDNGAVGLLTGDVVDRARLYEQAVALAFIPFRNELLYPSNT